MPAGGDKGFTFDPPGAIGIVADDAAVLLRFHGPDVTVRPKDEAGALDDLAVPVVAVAPAVTGAACGNGRRFDGATTALAAPDLATGSSLLTRDITVMAILSWDIVAQNAAAHAGVLVCRGLSTSAPEYVAYELTLAVVDAPSRRGSIAWSWQTIGGVVKAQTPVEFTCPTGFTMLTATRRWDSPTSVVCRYYIGDVLLGEVASSDGDIGGATTGTFLLGADKAGGALGRWLAGTLDELAIFPREMCREEIEATWLRITVYQPLGVQLFREMHDPGFPITTDPASDFQLESRQIGMALGYAASIFEQVRRNVLPQRAYGAALENWEGVLRPTEQPGRSFDDRRARVLARFRQRGGCAPPQLSAALSSLLDGAPTSDLEFLSFDNTATDGFDTVIDRLRWDMCVGTFTVTSGQASITTDSAARVPPNSWYQLRRAVGGSARQAHQVVKLRFVTSHANGEAGILFGDAGLGNYFLLGLRDTGLVNYHIFTETFTNNISQGGATDQGDSGVPIGVGVPPIWLYLHQAETFWEVSWSLVSGTTGFTTPLPVASAPPEMQWASMYVRTAGVTGAPLVANFDDHVLRSTFGTVTLNAYVLLDRALGFSPDVPGSRQIVGTMKHAFVHGSFLTTPWLLADDVNDGADVSPCGGY